MAVEQLREERQTVVAAGFEVYKARGYGFPEAVYRECLAIEFQLRGVPFRASPRLAIEYKGHPLQTRVPFDFLCWEGVVVNVVTVPDIPEAEIHRMRSLITSVGAMMGIVLNFGNSETLTYKRVMLMATPVSRRTP